MSLDMDQDSDSWDLIQYYAAPITQDGLSFNGREVYVQTESRHRVARADASRLHSLLTYTTPPPVLTKAGKVAKRQPPPHKDETEEFYVAQLMHYGLKPLKTKEAAKKALLAAFGPGNTLEVPPRILELKEKMRKEYSEANKIAKAKYLEDQKQEKLKEEEKRKKRKRETDAILENFTAQANKKGKTNAKVDVQVPSPCLRSNRVFFTAPAKHRIFRKVRYHRSVSHRTVGGPNPGLDVAQAVSFLDFFPSLGIV
jgi:hypothetical protein